RVRLGLRRYARRAEVGRGVALQPLDDGEIGCVFGELEPSELRDLAVPGRVCGEGFEGCFLRLARPAPARPAGGAGECALAADLDVDRGLRHIAELSRRSSPGCR